MGYYGTNSGDLTRFWTMKIGVKWSDKPLSPPHRSAHDMFCSAPLRWKFLFSWQFFDQEMSNRTSKWRRLRNFFTYLWSVNLNRKVLFYLHMIYKVDLDFKRYNNPFFSLSFMWNKIYSVYLIKLNFWFHFQRCDKTTAQNKLNKILL